jgi:hypothetical protein
VLILESKEPPIILGGNELVTSLTIVRPEARLDAASRHSIGLNGSAEVSQGVYVVASG